MMISLLPIYLSLTTRFLYDIGFKGCRRVEIEQKWEQSTANTKTKFIVYLLGGCEHNREIETQIIMI